MLRALPGVVCVCFFFQAEDGIRDWSVTGVQTCALPICAERIEIVLVAGGRWHVQPEQWIVTGTVVLGREPEAGRVRAGLVSETGRERARVADERDELRHRRRSEERRVGKEYRTRQSREE